MLYTQRLMIKEFVKSPIIKGFVKSPIIKGLIGVTVGIVLLSLETPAFGFRSEGIASYYGPGFVGKRTARGDIFSPRGLTAAHNTLPFGSLVKVTNLRNGRSVVVTINDRGGFNGDHPRIRKSVNGRREIDLSQKAFASIAKLGEGLVPVKLEVIKIGSNTRIRVRGSRVRTGVRPKTTVRRRNR